MTTLITGGTGRTGLGLAKLLHAANYPVLIATRTGVAPAPFKAVKFDWNDASTHEAAFDTADPPVDRVYIVGPPASTDVALHTKFVELAISKGVKRFALMSATVVGPDANSPFPAGVVHQQLIDAGVDFVVVRPTWFIQNFDNLGITNFSTIFSAAQDGKVPFVSTEDISQAVFEGLTAEKSPNDSIFVVGPELLTYEDAAKIISSVLGRTITYKRNTIEEQAALYTQVGAPADYAKLLAALDADVAKGTEEAVFNDAEAAAKGRLFVGKHTLLEFFKEGKNVQAK
ncbi:Agroclavine dehydrogenase [Psilocybe cubensis]|uniref:NmrA-like domain-containing protein n=2 Tax=Psilocybe cubensis TaxID=181762 RepID=A0A8H8CQ78_PSICU|nr:Agroclavine dehydrogenase [Psilocybe cubensis]KAH9487303.1 Agroclavine dehydrogenase [Psilocybe cubensis]